ncbi:MAG: hypothetical protein F4177_08625 [Chloroflexi bacterium]|nr:hypothetical protein [Chloroflexota bacterium]
MLTPGTIEDAFGVRSEIHRDPATGALMVSLIAAVDEEPDADLGVGETASAREAGIPRRDESEAAGVIS